MKKLIWLVALLVIFPLIAAACGGDDISTDDAEKAVRAIFEGDIDTANEYICEAEQGTAEDLEGMPTEGFEVTDVSCEKDGDAMNCSYTVSVSLGEGEEPMEMSDTMSIAIEDGKLCGDLGPSQ